MLAASAQGQGPQRAGLGYSGVSAKTSFGKSHESPWIVLLAIVLSPLWFCKMQSGQFKPNNTASPIGLRRRMMIKKKKTGKPANTKI